VMGPSLSIIASLRWVGVNAPKPRNISGPRDGERAGPKDDSRGSSYLHI
jgi:hypothetical protein